MPLEFEKPLRYAKPPAEEDLDRILAVPWFEKCGVEPFSDDALSVRVVPDWSRAIKKAESVRWEDVQTDRQGDLSVHVSKRMERTGSEWNELAIAARDWIVSEVEPRLAAAAADIPDFDRVALTVRWDLQHFLIFSAYRRLRPPEYYATLFRVYEAGHFPCGWAGPYPDGELSVL